jgi:hypothetical protein
MLEVLGRASVEWLRYLEVARAVLLPCYVTSLLSISLWITGHFAYKQPLKEKLKFLRNGINK